MWMVVSFILSENYDNFVVKTCDKYLLFQILIKSITNNWYCCILHVTYETNIVQYHGLKF